MSDDAVSTPPDGTGPWVLGTCMALLALLGLIMASAAGDGGFYVTGLILFLVNAFSIFLLIAKCVGRHSNTAASQSSLE